MVETNNSGAEIPLQTMSALSVFKQIIADRDTTAFLNHPIIKKLKLAVWILVGISLLWTGFWIINDHKAICKQHPLLESTYNKIGFPIPHAGDGLEWQNVRSDRHYDSGAMKLVVEGEIVNSSQKQQTIPDFEAMALASSGQIMKIWSIAAPVATLQPKEIVTFQSSVNPPQGTVAEIKLNFIEPIDDKSSSR